MQSLKSRLYYFAIKRKLAQLRKLGLPLPQARALGDQNSARIFKMPQGILTDAASMAEIQGEWLRPAAKRTQGLLLYLHGGAYVQGSVKTSRAMAARLALASQTATFIVDYRLAPEHPFPAALDDAIAVYGALQKAHPGRPIAIAGDSAGGGLTVATAMRIRDQGLVAPAALALLSPWTDLTLSNATHKTRAAVDPFFPDGSALSLAAKAYAWGRNLKTPLISPQFADLSRLPPTLIHVGDLEALLDDSRMLAEGILTQGGKAELKVYPGMWHVWQAFGGRFREADQSLAEIGAFLRARLEH